MERQDTQGHVLRWPCKEVWHTYNAMAPDAATYQQVSTTTTSGKTYAVTISPRCSWNQSKSRAHKWVSKPKKSAQDQCTWEKNDAPPSKSGHIHYMYGDSVEYQYHDPLRPHILSYHHIISGRSHGIALGLFSHPSIPLGITLQPPEAGPIIDLYWGVVGGLAQDWCGI